MMSNKSSMSMRLRFAADDADIKFSKLAIGVVEPLPVIARCGRSHRPHGSWKSRTRSHLFWPLWQPSNHLGNPPLGFKCAPAEDGKDARPDEPPFEQSMRQLEGSICEAATH
jgi:hypothetical protein